MPKSNSGNASATPKSLQMCAMVGVIGNWEPVEADADGDSVKLRRFSMVAYTGNAMTLAGWSSPVVVDLAGIRISAKPRPILKDHNPSLIVGHTSSIRVEGSQMLVSGVISGAGPVAREIIESSLNGFPWQASIGATVQKAEFVPAGKQAQANGATFDGPVYIVRRSVLGEVSFVALGADDDTIATVAATRACKEINMEFAGWLEAKGLDIDSLDDEQRENLEAAYRVEESRKADGAGAAGDAGDSREAVARIRAELAAETRRVARIRRICAGRHADIEERAIAEGWDADRTELEVLRAARPVVGVARSDGDGVGAAALEAALCLRAGIPEREVASWYDDRTMEAALSSRLRGAGLHTLFYRVIDAGGGHVRPGVVDNEFIRAAFEASERMVRASGGFSTISLSGILSNVANKAMLAAYQAVDSVVGFIAAETDVSDFKEVTRYRLTGNGIFEKVGPDGELKHATLSEEAYTNRVETYGRMFALTRPMIINDDLGAFLQIPRIIGRMSALARERAVFELLLANPGNFFSTGNGNYITGADTALSIDGLTKAEQTLMDQVDSDGNPIMISPAVLLVPSSLKVTAQVLMTETRVNETTSTDKPKPAANPHAGKWQPVASPFLNAQGLAGSSSKAWYLFANPADVAAVEIAYLRGQRTPTIESGQTDFNTLGIQWRGYFDFGVALQDHRAVVKSKGEA